MSDLKKWEHECSEENAAKFLEWIATRDGVTVWKSQDLGDPTASWSTPYRTTTGELTKPPHWKCGPEQTPEVFTDPSKIGVYASAPFAFVPVRLRQHGLALVLTKASERRLNSVMERCRKAHGSAWYRKGGLSEPSVEVRYTVETVALSEWAAKRDLLLDQRTAVAKDTSNGN